MSLVIPNVNKLTQQDAKLGEALVAIQKFTNLNVAVVPGNRQAPPPFVDPTKPAGS